jgi:predicted flavoprotein YhiN
MHELTGLSFPWARLQARFLDGAMQSVDGPVLLTHFGISGPNVFALSALLAFEKIALDTPVDIVLYPEADTSYDMWIARFHEAASHSPKKELRTIMKQWFPERLAIAMLAACAIDSATWMGVLTKDNKKDIAHFLAG